jgi:hypothetical protein
MKMNFKIFSILFFCTCVGCDLGEKKDCVEEEYKIMVFKGKDGKWKKASEPNEIYLRPTTMVQRYLDFLGWSIGLIRTKKGERLVIDSAAGSDRIVLLEEYKIRCLLDGLAKVASYHGLEEHTSNEIKLTSRSRFDAGEIGVAYDTSQDEHESSLSQSLFLNGRRICLYRYREDEKGGSKEEFKCEPGVTFQSLMKDLERNGVRIKVVCEAFEVKGMMNKDEIRCLRELSTDDASAEEILSIVTSQKVQTEYAMCLVFDIDKKYMPKVQNEKRLK